MPSEACGWLPVPDGDVVVDSFREAMEQVGIVTRVEIVPDGKLRRFEVEGDKNGSRNGWYVLHRKPYPVGRFGAWNRDGIYAWELPLQKQLSREEREKQFMLMLQSLLADRFKLTFRQETKELAVYALTVAKNGPMLHQTPVTPGDSALSDPGPPGASLRRGGIQMRRGELIANGVALDRFADVLSRILGRMVVDKTSLKDLYEFTLNWTPEEGQGPMIPGTGDPGAGALSKDAAPPDATGPTIFTALQEQLGLKLESQKGPVDTIVIEHVEKPSQN